ncbi:MAG TPA: hypothetical protein VF911_00740 [Thermoanaerobaculia bacterium]|jgi:hypothetical protein
MPERVSFIRHKSTEILMIDWSNATADEILTAIEEAKKKIASRPEKSVRTLTNVTNARADRRVTEALKEYVAHNKPFVLAGAVVGLNDLKTILFNFVNRATGRTLRAMDSVDQAKEWLISAHT